MPPCKNCGKILASPAGLGRHVNTQHKKSKLYACECGKSFLDPSRRSRCRAGHSQYFACSAWRCDYRNCRKDAVKQHVRRRHKNFPPRDLLPLTLPVDLGYSGQSSNAGLEFEFAPTPSDLLSPSPSIIQPQLDMPVPYFIPSPPYYPGASPDSCPPFY